jgi:cytidylate kinase
VSDGAGETGRDVVVTIDGPAGAGKSTVARRLAERLGFEYVNSGAIYRAVAWRVSRGEAVETALRGLRIQFVPVPGGQRVRVDGRDVTEALSSPAVSELAASLSQRSDVRGFADRLQRAHAARGPVVVEGRDAGTVVFPNAECKFYLDASPEARARRRFAEQKAGGAPADLGAIRAAIEARDAADRTRPVAPLERSADATYVDSSSMTVDEVVELMAKEVERACSTRS